ncbi:acyltransferase family protein [Streptomyces sp. NPDC055082]|uniref:acyltransferase family protein n=1 Tax=Streptomyces sp. NPDC055082 TaxID=3365718 RepID=UPI0037D2484C
MTLLAGTGVTPRTARLEKLTGLRFIAAALVFAFHASVEGFFSDAGIQDGFAALFQKAGWIGVSFFFVLSGFVLAWTARPDDTARRFWQRRLAKIYPNHLVTAVIALTAAAGVSGALALPGAVPNLLLVHAWYPRIEIFLSGNPVSWSLACELLFYLSFPLLWRFLSRIGPAHLWGCAAATAVAIWCVPLLAQLLPDGPQAAMPDGTVGVTRFWFVYVLPSTRVLEFVLGILVARIVREGLLVRVRVLPAAALVLASYWLACQVPYLFSLVALPAVPLALLVAAVTQADLAGPPRGSGPAARVPVWLGEVSFGFYMVHGLVLLYGHRLLGAGESLPAPVAVAVILAAFVVSLVLAWLLHTVVEQPVVRWTAARQRRRAPVRRDGHVLVAPAGGGGAPPPPADDPPRSPEALSSS